MKHKMLAVLMLSLSTGTFAAKFTTVKKMTDPKLEKLSKVFLKVTKNEKVFGDCSSHATLSIEKKKSELNLNTMKQLNISRGGNWTSDGETTWQSKPTNAFSTIRSMLSADSDNDWLDDDQKVIFEAGTQEIADALYEATKGLKDKTKEFYESNHSNEDGTWSILSIYDVKNQEVLLMQAGFCGT